MSGPIFQIGFLGSHALSFYSYKPGLTLFWTHPNCLGHLLETYNVMRHLSSEQIHMKWKIIEKKYALRSVTKGDLKVPERPKLKCLGFTYNGAKLFNMLPIQMRKTENPNTFKIMTKDWIWENIPSY